MKTTVLYLGLVFFFCNSAFGQTDSAAVVLEVDSLIKTATKMANSDKSKDALPLAIRAKELSQTTFGNKHPKYALSLLTLGNIHRNLGKYKEAESFFMECKTIRAEVLGTQSIEYAEATNNLGLMYYLLGRYADAEPHLEEATAIRKAVLGKTHVDYASSLINLSVTTHARGQFVKSELLLLEAKGILELNKSNQPSRFYANCLSLLALNYIDLCRYDAAEKNFKDAEKYTAANFGAKSVIYGNVLGSLGAFYFDIGNYAEAENCYLKAKEIKKAVMGEEHPSYGILLMNFANVYAKSGRFDEAEPFFIQALKITEKTTGKETEHYSTALNNLGQLYLSSHRYADAERVLLEGNALAEKLAGRDNIKFTNSLHNISGLYEEMKDYKKAEVYALECKSILEKVAGEKHYRYGLCLQRLANIYQAQGDLTLAEPLLHKAKEVFLNSLGKEHLDYALILFNLADLYVQQHQFDKAAPLYLEGNGILKRLIVSAMGQLSEKELGTFSKYFSKKFNTFFSFLESESGKTPTVLHDAFDNAIFNKNLLLNTIQQMRDRMALDTSSIEPFESLTATRRRLAKQYVLPITERDTILIAELETQANTLEKELVSRVLGTGFGQALRQINWQDVQAALQPGQAALEFIRFKYYNPLPTDSVLYAALLLLPGTKTPVYVSLFEEKQLQNLLSPLASQGSEGLNALYGGPAGQTLHHLLWAPLEPQLAGVNTIFFSPAGLLHRLNLSAIPSSKPKQTLGQRYSLHLLGSTRQLAETAAAPALSSTAALFGGIRYDMDSTALTAATTDELANRHRGLSFAQTDSTLRTGSWQYLKYSEQEAVNIQTQLKKAGFQATLHQGYAASEEAFKQLGKGQPSPRILHISTHGYFFPDPQTSSTTGSPYATEQAPVFKLSEHPMIRSGLILAGANHAWASGKPLGNREDGILTAYEISQMDLRHTELVVLSACETGLGDIRGNEGVYGLQRAFKIAGAQHLIMSLWQVPDYQTQELMTIFYQKWLTEKQSVPQALKAAQAEMQRRRYEPFYWAGFVLVE